MHNDVREEMLEPGNVKMRCIRFGKGTSDLIMIQGLNTNGLKGTAGALARMYRLFAEKYTVYLFDRREDVFEGINVRQMAADIAMAMDTLHITKADILGISQGGMIAQYLAIDRPDLVRKLVLTVTLSRNNEITRETIGCWINYAEGKEFRRLVEDMTEKLYSETYVKKLKPLLSLLTAVQTPRNIERFLILTKACLTCNTYDELDKIKCPVLVIGGAKDKVVTAEASKEIAQKLGCEIYIYEELGHAVYDEAGDFKKRVLDFFCREEAARSEE